MASNSSTSISASSNPDVGTWTPEQVAAWVAEKGFEQSIANLFVTQKVDGLALLEMTQDDVKGPPFNFVFGDAKKFMRDVNTLCPTDTSHAEKDTLQVDATLTVLGTLLQQFDFPRKFDITQVCAILTLPLTTKIFSTIRPRTTLEKEYFTYNTEDVCPSLAAVLLWALSGDGIPGTGASEMEWSGYWDSFFFGSFLRIATDKFMPDVKFHRNVVDDCSTYPNLKRDFLLWAKRILLFAGEDKAAVADAKAAKEELYDKTQANPALYGKLEYFLAFTTAGPMIEFFAIVFLPAANEEQEQQKIRVYPLDLKYDISTDQRADAYLVLINVCRWLRSVVAADVLDAHAISTTEPEIRTNPYTLEQNTTIINKGRYVLKTFLLPPNHITRFERVYYALERINSKNHSKLKDLRITSSLTGEGTGTSRRKYLGKGVVLQSKVTARGVWIILQIVPVGARRTPVGDEQIFECFDDILTFLISFHAEQLTHYDLRWANILVDSAGNWFVIDFENSDAIGELPWWDNAELRIQRDVPRSIAIDLYQVGVLLEGTGRFVAISSQLKHDLFPSAHAAREALRAAADPNWVRSVALNH